MTTQPNIEGDHQRTLLTSILESSNDSILSADANGIITSWNAASERMYGYLAKEAIGQPLSLIVPPEGRQDVAACLAKILGNEQVDPYKTHRLRKDGSTFPIFLTVSPIYDENGVVVGASGIEKDITQEEQANLYARNMASIIDSSNDSIISLNIEGIIQSWNPGAERTYGYLAEEAIGKSISLIVPPENTEEIADNQRKLRNGYTIKPYETIRIRKDGSSIPILLTISPVFDENGVVIGSSAIARDITEQKQSSLYAHYMASIIESSNDAITSSDLEGICTNWNPAAELIFGYTAEEMIGQSFSCLVLPENFNEEVEQLRQIQAGKTVDPYETQQLRKDGGTVWISLSLSPIFDDRGAVIGVSGIARDITKEKLASQYVRNMASIIESSNDAITSANLDRIYTSWNPAAERIFGYSAQEMIGQPISIIVPPENASEDYENLRKIRAGDQIESYETLRIKKDGTVIPIALTISIIYNEAGAVIGTSAISRDITQEKQASQYVRNMASIIESSNDAVTTANMDRLFTSWNPAAERIFGYSAQEMIGKSTSLIIPPEIASEHYENLRKILAGDRIQPFETLRIKKDGSIIPIAFTISVICDEDGAVIGTSAISRDITEEQKASQYARNMASIIDSSHEAIASSDMNGLCTSWNAAAERMYGYSAKEMIGQTFSFSQLDSSKSIKEVAKNLNKIRGGTKIEPYETNRIRKDGSTIPISLTVSPIYDGNGVVIGSSGIARDITQEKKASQYARDLASIIESSNDSITSTNMDGICTSWNSASERMFGYSAQEMIGQPFSLLISSEDTHEFADVLSNIRSGSNVEPYETTRIRKDGSAIPIALALSPIYDGNGVVVGGSGIARDITQEKLASQYARNMAAIIESSNDAITGESLEGIITSWNPGAERMYGYSAEEIIGQPFSCLIPSENTNEFTDNLRKILDGYRIEPYETVRIRKDGSSIPVSLAISPIYDENGVSIGSSAISRDITQQKAFEKAQVLATIVEFSIDSIVSTDPNGIIISWNPASERIYGYSAKEMIGQSHTHLLSPENAHEEIENWRKIRDGIKIEPYETVRFRKDGSTIPISLTVSPIFDGSGGLIGDSAIARDITEERRASQNARDLASIVESSNDAISSANLDGICTSWNSAAERMYGYSAKEIIGQTFSLLTSPENAHEDIENLSNIRNGKKIQAYETVRIRKDGSTIPISLTVSPIFDGNGVVIGSSAIARDFTQEKKASQYARDLASIVESSNDAISSANLDGICTSWNSAAERMYGYSANEMIGQTFSHLIPPEKSLEAAENLENIRNGIEIDPYETVRITKDGRHISILLTISPIFDGNNVVIGSSASIRDITDQKKQMQQLVAATEQRNEFVAMVAHDIRSPATSISGFSNLLIDRWGSIDDLKKLDHLKVIVRKAEQLANFVEDVLQVSGIEAGEFNLELGDFDICELVQKALLEIAGPKAGQRFYFIAEQEIPLVMGDRERQLEVLMNLLTNAAKFSPETEPITIKLALKKDWVEVSVTDHGIGVLKADQHKLFQKFGRLHQPGLQRVSGTGLGLFICKNLVEAQGGRIWYENVPGQGSTFTYTIPIGGVSTPITGISAKTVAPFRVLVVEDDLDMGQLIQAALSTDPRLEYIGQAAKASEAVELALKLSPALVILDHQIDGDIHGLQAAPMIKSISPESRIILFTSQDIAVEAGRELSIDLFLSKSEINKLVAAAQQVLGLSPLV